MRATPQRRWSCPNCKATGWSSDGRMPSHDTSREYVCRPSGQVTEAECKKRLTRTLAAKES